MNVAEQYISSRGSEPGSAGKGTWLPGELSGSLCLEVGRPETGSREEHRVMEGFCVSPRTDLCHEEPRGWTGVFHDDYFAF